MNTPARKPTRSESRATPAHVKAQYAPDTPIPTPERTMPFLEQRPKMNRETQLIQTQQKLKFCDKYAVNANFTEAATFAGVDPRDIYSWLRIDPEFQQQYEQAKTRALDRLQGVLWAQAEKNPLLLMFTLKRHIPEYRDSFKIDVQHTINDQSLDLSKLSTEQLEMYLELQRIASRDDVIDVVSHVLEDSIDT
jgi:hypothetical protein